MLWRIFGARWSGSRVVLKLKLILKPQERQDELAKVLLRVLSGQSHSNDSYWAQRQRVIKL
jgi:hypothetical protein